MAFNVSGSNPDKYTFIKLPPVNKEAVNTAQPKTPDDFSLLFETNNNVFGTLGRANPIKNVQTEAEAATRNTERLNDLDSNLFQKKAPEKIEDHTLRLEEQINNTLNELNSVNAKLELLNLLNFEYDKKRIEEYKKRKSTLEAKLKEYRASYRKLNAACNASDIMTEALQKAGSQIEKGSKDAKNSFIINFAAKIMPGINKNIVLRNTISNLTIINKNIEEIMRTKAQPIGEEDAQRASLIAFLSKAGSIEASISKALNEN